MLGSLLSSSAAVASGPHAGYAIAAVCGVAAAVLGRQMLSGASLDRRLVEMAAREAALEEAVLTDAVTGLRNRLAFSRNLEKLIARGGSEDVNVLFLDLDKFKEVNDTLGHKIGDELLKGVAQRLSTLISANDTLARIGGDEFAAIVCLDPAHPVDELAIAIVEAIYEPFLIDGHLVHVGASVGVSKRMDTATSADDLLRQADIAMYDAKFSKTDSFRIFDERMSSMIALRSNMRSELESAIANDGLLLKYQPIVDAHTGKLSSVEALLRWPHSSQGEISPTDLIPLAEESGQIMALGSWILEKALLAAREFEDVPVAVNVSPIQFRHHGFATIVGDKLYASGVAPGLLRLEITEGVLISHMDAAKSTIRQLRNIGVAVALDDFGTGYSSLSYLQNLDFDCMKIDKSFLRDVGRRQLATKVLRSIIELGHSLDLKVVAEGIENAWQARLLTMLNCDYLQGYYFGTPMELDELIAFKTHGLQEARDPIACEPVRQDLVRLA